MREGNTQEVRKIIDDAFFATGTYRNKGSWTDRCRNNRARSNVCILFSGDEVALMKEVDKRMKAAKFSNFVYVSDTEWARGGPYVRFQAPAATPDTAT